MSFTHENSVMCVYLQCVTPLTYWRENKLTEVAESRMHAGWFRLLQMTQIGGTQAQIPGERFGTPGHFGFLQSTLESQRHLRTGAELLPAGSSVRPRRKPGDAYRRHY